MFYVNRLYGCDIRSSGIYSEMDVDWSRMVNHIYNVRNFLFFNHCLAVVKQRANPKYSVLCFILFSVIVTKLS